MKLNETIRSNKNLLLNLCFVVFVFILSFPNLEPDFNTGLDSPFRWGYNHLWIHDYSTLSGLIYSYGPLAFFKVPVALGNNFLYFLVFYSFSKIIFLLGLIYSAKKTNRLLTYTIAFIVSYFLQVDTIIIGIVLLGSIFYLKKREVFYYLISIVFALIGLYIKSSIGISCLGIIGGLWVLLLAKPTSKRSLIILFGLSLCLILLTNMVIGNDIFYFSQYLYNVLNVSSGYSSSMALYPKNNWFLLSLALLSIALVPVIANRPSKVNFFLFFIPLFSFWKHAMVRETAVYYMQLVKFLVFFWGVLILTCDPSKKKIYLIISLCSIMLFLSNIFSLHPIYKLSKDFNGIPNFNSSIINYGKKMETMAAISAGNVSRNVLNPELKALIGTKKVDVYPWDFSYIAANDLNWQPRITFQSVGISDWADKKSQNSFSALTGPEFVIFQSKKDNFGGEFGSLDGRFMLNSEPLTNTQLFKNYTIVQQERHFSLFQKSASPNLRAPELLQSETSKWGTWISVPSSPRGILKLKLGAEKTLLGKTITLLYKDDHYTVEYKLKSGEILRYRFVTAIAKNGLWINPMINSFKSHAINKEVVAVRFSHEHSSMSKNTLQLEWICYPKIKKEKENLF